MRSSMHKLPPTFVEQASCTARIPAGRMLRNARHPALCQAGGVSCRPSAAHQTPVIVRKRQGLRLKAERLYPFERLRLAACCRLAATARLARAATRSGQVSLLQSLLGACRQACAHRHLLHWVSRRKLLDCPKGKNTDRLGLDRQAGSAQAQLHRRHGRRKATRKSCVEHWLCMPGWISASPNGRVKTAACLGKAAQSSSLKATGMRTKAGA